MAELCHRYGALMKQRRAGRILNVASTAAFQPTPYFAAYGAAKAFVLNFSEALVKEMEEPGVSISCLAPSPTDTAFFDGTDSRRIGGGLTRVVGAGNRVMILGNRFAPRAAVAAISKRLLRPRDLPGSAG